ncbi:MAG: CocE/NonD family hydrolase [Mycobacteriales bacterium]|nr:CocE/NonD family hydrolase [Frankia sp.]
MPTSRLLRRWPRVATVLALVVTGLAVPRAQAASPTGYVTLSDGTSIAVALFFPKGYKPGQRLPAIFEMAGYENGSAQGRTILGELADQTGIKQIPLQDDSRQLTTPFTDAGYIVMHASVRGTGCSGGQFDLFSWRSALDGNELIEWMARQKWSNGKVAIMGHSYSGITGFMVAATRPKHLVAATVSGLIDDVYRGLSWPGGIENGGFPVLWTYGVRPVYDVAGGTGQGLLRTQNPQCARNVAEHRPAQPTDEPLLNGVDGSDSQWFRSHSLLEYVDRIDVPMHIWEGWQDEQTGPRGPAHLWESLSGVPKRFLGSNSNHTSYEDVPYIVRDRVAWIDHWMGRANHGFGTFVRGRRGQQVSSTVETLFEVKPGAKPGTWVPNGVKRSRTWPLEDTRWTDLFLGTERALVGAPTRGPGGSDTYFSGSQRQSWQNSTGETAGHEFSTPDGPDQLRYTTAPLRANLAVSGPITANLWLSSSAPDTEMFVQVIDVAPDGSRSYLQRGMLKASHRAWVPAFSDYTPAGHLYRPWRPHTNPQPVTPGTATEYLIEIWPLGHIFRAGHEVQIEIEAPPASDNYYNYIPHTPAAINTVYHDETHRSRITLPVVSLAGVKLGREVPCGQQLKVRCIAP